MLKLLNLPIILVLMTFLISDAGASGVCSGKIINPVRDICWECVFPVKIGKTARISKKGPLPDIETDAKSFCFCGNGLNVRTGINISFWQPVRTAEIVRHSGCSPLLNGIRLPMANAPEHISVHKKVNSTTRRHTRFYHVHWFVSPWLFIIEALLDQACLEQASFDLAYVSELDPLWNDNLASFIIDPDAAMFANPAAVTACSGDCLQATLSTSNPALYWCSGCQGSLFPLTGWTGSSIKHASAWFLLSHRFAVKLARQGLLWSTHGRSGQCAPYLQPLLRKDAWRFQLLLPHRSKCQPLGRSSAEVDSMKVHSPGGEDGAVLMFQKRDCCSQPSSISATLP